MYELEKIEVLLESILSLLKEKEFQSNKKEKDILTTEQTMKYFGISRPTVIQLFSMKGSPAFKTGNGKGHWRVDAEKFEKFMIKKTEYYKS